jgi:hypothetical protein
MLEFTQAQKDRLVEIISTKFHLPKEQVLNDIKENKCVAKCDGVSFPLSLVL